MTQKLCSTFSGHNKCIPGHSGWTMDCLSPRSTVQDKLKQLLYRDLPQMTINILQQQPCYASLRFWCFGNEDIPGSWDVNFRNLMLMPKSSHHSNYCPHQPTNTVWRYHGLPICQPNAHVSPSLAWSLYSVGHDQILSWSLWLLWQYHF